MDTDKLKRLMDDNCRQLAEILDDCRSGPAEAALVAEVMGPVLQEFRELGERVFGDVEQASEGTPPRSTRQRDGR